MRQLASIFALIAIVVLCPGCFVIEELDSGMEQMKEQSINGSKRKRAEPEEAPVETATKKKNGRKIDLAGWWKKARTPASGPREPGAAIEVVSCRIGGEVRFMSRTDCLVQGGRP